MSGGRRALRWSVAVALLASVTGCAPGSPVPSPTPTGFASEEEAFAAAEATYRAYVDALNDVDLSDPATFEPVYALLAGDALNGSKKELTSLHSEGLRKEGETSLADVSLVEYSQASREAILDVCLDVSDVEIRRPDGTSVVPDDRNDLQELRVVLASVTPSGTDLRISSSQTQGDQPCG
ncbi:hypothetical protein AB3M83_10130 [Microbacterium sp. 179-B 1A2 NHS]|uniref:hypothetical protein n=1 Tax=Microbacterium sp. 179-B 1A2 NHS TaxID=3142383 RepID=UPI00399FEA25